MLIRRKFSFILIIIMLFAMLAGCGAKSSSDNVKSEANQAYPTEAQDITVSEDSGPVDRKLIEYWDFNIEVSSTAKILADIESKTHSLKGYIVESQINNNPNHINAYLIVKIPQENLNQMTQYLQTVGQVKNSSNRTEDITMEYYDTEARLEVLKKQEERLLAFMDGKTNNIQDLLAVEQELSRVRADRESLQARMNYLNNATSYSQISINLRQSSGGEITAPQGTWGKSVQGLISSLNSLINLGNNLIIGIFMAAPYLLIIGIVYFIANYIRNRKKK